MVGVGGSNPLGRTNILNQQAIKFNWVSLYHYGDIKYKAYHIHPTSILIYLTLQRIGILDVTILIGEIINFMC